MNPDYFSARTRTLRWQQPQNRIKVVGIGEGFARDQALGSDRGTYDLGTRPLVPLVCAALPLGGLTTKSRRPRGPAVLSAEANS